MLDCSNLFPYLRGSTKCEDLGPESRDLSKRVGHAPDAVTETGELHNLRVIDKEVDIDAELANVPT